MGNTKLASVVTRPSIPIRTPEPFQLLTEPDEARTGKFQRITVPPPAPRKERTTAEVLDDASASLNMFLNDISLALMTEEMTVDQRVHMATIASYVEGLAARFDRVRAPGYIHPKR